MDTGAVVTLVGMCEGERAGWGCPWAFCTNAIEEMPVEFTRKGLLITKLMHEKYATLSNYVDERNTVHVKWLEWMGYKMMQRTTSYSLDGAPFLRFERTRPNV